MLYIILPCLNESENLKIIIPEIQNVLKGDYKILVCYDCSNDNTKEVVENFKNTELLEYQKQKGLGIAFKRLFLRAIGQGKNEDIIIGFDADNTHSPEGIKLLLEKINSGYDVAIQSRFCKESSNVGFSIFRMLISKSISFTMSSFFPVGEKIKDYTSSYRAYRLSILKTAFEKWQNNFITETEFTYTIETMVKLGNLTKKICETPLQYRYDKKIGKSKLRIIKNGIRFACLFFKLLIFKIKNKSLIKK
jgi:dolichol-phosphate mannosyltransferase